MKRNYFYKYFAVVNVMMIYIFFLISFLNLFSIRVNPKPSSVLQKSSKLNETDENLGFSKSVNVSIATNNSIINISQDQSLSYKLNNDSELKKAINNSRITEELNDEESEKEEKRKKIRDKSSEEEDDKSIKVKTEKKMEQEKNSKKTKRKKMYLDADDD